MVGGKEVRKDWWVRKHEISSWERGFGDVSGER